jgi:hypothetical protein
MALSGLLAALVIGAGVLSFALATSDGPAPGPEYNANPARFRNPTALVVKVTPKVRETGVVIVSRCDTRTLVCDVPRRPTTAHSHRVRR